MCGLWSEPKSPVFNKQAHRPKIYSFGCSQNTHVCDARVQQSPPHTYTLHGRVVFESMHATVWRSLRLRHNKSQDYETLHSHTHRSPSELGMALRLKCKRNNVKEARNAFVCSAAVIEFRISGSKHRLGSFGHSRLLFL